MVGDLYGNDTHTHRNKKEAEDRQNIIDNVLVPSRRIEGMCLHEQGGVCLRKLPVPVQGRALDWEVVHKVRTGIRIRIRVLYDK